MVIKGEWWCPLKRKLKIKKHKFTHKKTLKKVAFQVYSRTKTNKACMILLERKIPLFFQRVSSFFFYRQKAAISVEASIAIPLFIFFVANLLVLLIRVSSFYTMDRTILTWNIYFSYQLINLIIHLEVCISRCKSYIHLHNIHNLHIKFFLSFH